MRQEYKHSILGHRTGLCIKALPLSLLRMTELYISVVFTLHRAEGLLLHDLLLENMSDPAGFRVQLPRGASDTGTHSERGTLETATSSRHFLSDLFNYTAPLWQTEWKNKGSCEGCGSVFGAEVSRCVTKRIKRKRRPKYI